VRVIHNAVDLAAFRPRDDAGRSEARRALGPEGPTVLFVGRLLPDPLRERLARAGRAAAEQRFSWDAMARATEELLR
jgi:glycosyltransferase involved in cell wall biosynthesis